MGSIAAAALDDPFQQLVQEFIQRLVEHVPPLWRHLLTRVWLAGTLVAAGPDEVGLNPQFVHRAFEEHHLHSQSRQVQVRLGLQDNPVGKRGDVIVFPSGHFQECPDRLPRLLELGNRPPQFLGSGPAAGRPVAPQYQSLDALIVGCRPNRADLVQQCGRVTVLSAQQVGDVEFHVLGNRTAQMNLESGIGFHAWTAAAAAEDCEGYDAAEEPHPENRPDSNQNSLLEAAH